MQDEKIENLIFGHQWCGTSVLIQTITKTSGRINVKFKTLDFSVLGINVEGFLGQCIRDTSAPMHCSEATTILAALKAISQKNSEFRKILSAHPETLAMSDIAKLLVLSDAYYKEKKLKSGAATAEKFRNFILGCQSPLAGGILAIHTPYVPTLKVAKRTSRKNIQIGENSIIKNNLLHPSEAIHAEDESNIRELAKKYYSEVLEPILTKCSKVLDAHEELETKLKLAEKSPFPNSLQKRTIEKFEKSKKSIDTEVVARRSEDEQLIIALAIVKKNQLHINAPSHNILYLQGLSCLDSLSGGKGSRTRFGALLSMHYLSRYVITACFIILLCYTRWNPGTLISITAKNVRRTAHGYEISGIKSKTNSNQNTSILSDDQTISIQESAAVRAIKLLLWHNCNVTQYAVRKNQSIFVSLLLLYSNVLEFDVFLDSDDFHEFTSAWNLPRFTPSDIRPSFERYHFLKQGMNIEDSRTTLYHRSIASSKLYVESEIATTINEANMIRFQAMLSKSIRFQCGDELVPSSFSKKQSETIKKMLIPTTRFSSNSEDYLVDKWLENKNDFKFNIGPSEVEQCVRQRRYYQKNMQLLRRANSERFSQSELPRILVCMALYNLIKTSPYNRFLQEIERDFDAQ
jgi:hypothetical protein